MDKLKFIIQDEHVSILPENIHRYSLKRHSLLELNQQKKYLFYHKNEKSELSPEELEQRKNELQRQKAILLRQVKL